MYNPDKSVETFTDWCEAAVTDFHDRSNTLSSDRYELTDKLQEDNSLFLSRHHKYIVLLFLVELNKAIGKLNKDKLELKLRQKISSLYGKQLLEELDFIVRYSLRLSRLKRLTPDLTAVLICNDVDYERLQDLTVHYLDHYDFVAKTADDLSDILTQNIDPHIKWLMKESGLQDVR